MHFILKERKNKQDKHLKQEKISLNATEYKSLICLQKRMSAGYMSLMSPNSFGSGN